MTETEGTVSVVIPVYNCENYIAQAIESVLRQTRAVLETIVVDDGSSDRSVGRVRDFGNRVRLIEQNNCGVAGARNTGLKAARGEFVAFLDADDWWEPNKIAQQLEAFDIFPDAGMVFSDFSVVGPNGERVMNSGIRWKYQTVKDPTANPWTRIFDNSAQLEVPSGRHTVYCGQVMRRLFCGNFVNTSSVLLRSAVVARAGQFSVSLDTEEDYDYWLRVSAEWPVAYIDSPLVVFRRSPGQLTRAAHIERVVSNALTVAKSAARQYSDRLTDDICKPRLAALYLALGVIALRRDRKREAREKLVCSIRLLPKQWLPWILYLVAWLPAGTLVVAERARSRWRRMFTAS